MISLTSATKRAEEFDVAVSGRTAQGDLRPELAELLDVVGAMRGIDAPAPRPDFVTSLRERLLEEAETALTRDAVLTLPPRRKGRERRLAVAASAFVLVGGTAGMAAAAQHALPGDALYPIKRGIEAAQTDLSRGQESKGQHLLDQADTRLHEVQALVAAHATGPEVEATLGDFADQASEGSQLLLGSSEDQPDPAAVDQVHTFTSSSMDALSTLAEQAPDLQSSLRQAADVLTHIDEQAATACPTCRQGRSALRLAPAFSATADAERALQALSTAKINNDHPTIGGIKDPAGQRKGSGKNGSTSTAGSTGSESGSTGVTGGGDDNSSVLPDLGGATGGLTGSTDTSTGGGGILGDVTGPVKDQVKKVKDAAPAPLDDALDQLLP